MHATVKPPKSGPFQYLFYKYVKEEVKAEAEDPLEDVEKCRDPVVLTFLEHAAVKNYLISDPFRLLIFILTYEYHTVEF